MKSAFFRLLPAFILVASLVASVRADQPDRSALPDRTMPRAVPQQKPGGEPGLTPEEPKSPRDLKLLRGDILMARKMYAEAIEVYKEVLRAEPRNAELLNKIGVAYHQMSRLGDAKKYYKRALKVDKKYAVAVNNLGMVNYDRKKYGSAIKDFRKALKINPYMPAVERNLGHAYYAHKKYDRALTAFARALAMDPLVFERRGSSTGSLLQGFTVEQRGFYFFFLAKAFAMMGDGERCAAYLRKAVDEGFVDLATIPKDPAFAAVLEHPQVQLVLNPGQPVASNPQPKP